jgi:hypothetical protein
MASAKVEDENRLASKAKTKFLTTSS